MNTTRTPVVFIHGPWLHASSRAPLYKRWAKDHTVPEAITRSTLKQYRGSDAVTDLAEFPDRGHSLTIDSGWRTVAGECLSWLAKQGL